MTNKLATIDSIFAVIGTAIAQALGGWDLALRVLVALVVLDYITGVVVAIFEKNLSSAIGGKGIVKKVMIFALVYVAVLVDKATNTDLIRTLTIMFYIANEGISVLENAGKLGVPYPAPLKSILVQLKAKSNGEGEIDEKSGT
jgi:toxin secretion/phage lysis holin